MADTKFTLRLPSDLLAELEKIATENERSVSAEIRLLIRKGVQTQTAA